MQVTLRTRVRDVAHPMRCRTCKKTMEMGEKYWICKEVFWHEACKEPELVGNEQKIIYLGG